MKNENGGWERENEMDAEIGEGGDSVRGVLVWVWSEKDSSITVS